MIRFMGAPFRRRLRLIAPHVPDWESRTLATCNFSSSFEPDRGNSSRTQSSCNWSLVRSVSASGVNCLGSWFRCNQMRCLRSLKDPVFLMPKTPSKWPRSLFWIPWIASHSRSHPVRTVEAIGFARSCSTFPVRGMPSSAFSLLQGVQPRCVERVQLLPRFHAGRTRPQRVLQGFRASAPLKRVQKGVHSTH